LRGQALANFAEAPHARQQGRDQLSEIAQSGYSQQKIGVSSGGGCGRFLLQFFTPDSELGCVGSVEAHLSFQRFLDKPGEADHRLQVWAACGGKS